MLFKTLEEKNKVLYKHTDKQVVNTIRPTHVLLTR